MDSDEVNEGASPFVEGVDPLLTEHVLKKPVPDFLDEEQQTLYRRAFSLLYYRSYPTYRSMEFTESLNYYVEPKNYRLVFRDETSSLIYTVSQGRYQNYDDFIELLHSVFTENYASEHFDYYNHNGKLTDIDASGIPSTYYSGHSKETFQLISKTDDEIIFNIHVYPKWYYQYPEETDEEFALRGQLEWEWIKVATVRMINTEDGWRFDHFYDSAIEGDTFGPPLSKEDFDVPVPDFLAFEQQLLYRWAHNAYSHLWGGSPRLIEYPEFLGYTIDESKYKTVEHENGRIYTLSQGYFKWHGYLHLIKSAFTEEEFNRQNKDLVYVDDFSLVAFDDSVTREPSQYKLCSKDEFELVSKNDKEIVFKLIGHYAAADDAENKEILTKEFTIRMVRLENNGIHTGWRFDEFHVTSIDV